MVKKEVWIELKEKGENWLARETHIPVIFGSTCGSRLILMVTFLGIYGIISLRCL
jgi:hypothetical protein